MSEKQLLFAPLTMNPSSLEDCQEGSPVNIICKDKTFLTCSQNEATGSFLSQENGLTPGKQSISSFPRQIDTLHQYSWAQKPYTLVAQEVMVLPKYLQQRLQPWQLIINIHDQAIHVKHQL